MKFPPRTLIAAAFTIWTILSVATAQSPKVLDAAELKIALDKLTVLGSTLYISAHPDDENTSYLAYMAKGRNIRAGYLAVTRGEGGQNLIGSEQGDLMGVIRTQELLGARRIDGAEQFFTRAIDFGYSKTTEETMRIWGKEKILADVVWVVRKFRPDVVVTRFTPTQGGHGNHTASAVLAEEAFRAASDSTRFPEQLKYVKTWQPKRLLWNVFRFQQSESPARPEHSVSLDLGEYSAVLGRSFTEIAGQSRSMHKTQGFGAGQNRGEFVNYFQHMLGDTTHNDLFDGIDISWKRVNGGEAIGAILREAQRTYDPREPAKLLPTLLKAYDGMSSIGSDPWVDVKKRELLEVIQSCAGMWIDALASDYSAVPGSDVKITTQVLNRSDYPLTLEKISISYRSTDTTLNVRLVRNKPILSTFVVRLPDRLECTQPFWLIEEPELGSYRISDQRLIGQPELPSPLAVRVTVASPDGRFDVDVPVRHRTVDPVEGELYRPFELIPLVALNPHERVFVFGNGAEKKVSLTVKSGSLNISGNVKLNVPPGWVVRPESIPFSLKNKNDELVVIFVLRPNSGSKSGEFSAEAEVGGQRVSLGMHTIRYPHIAPQTLFPRSEGKLLRIDLAKKGENVGYIMGSGDDVPLALQQAGYRVTLLSDDDLTNKNLAAFDAIIAGVRSYNTRPQLKVSQKRLMDYVQAGGTYIVQYVTQQRLESENLGPYPFNVSRDRVTVEEAPVTFVNPTHALLNFPNKITAEDFKGWAQERGLYFADKWDDRYDTILSSNDPGEPEKKGGLIYARYGKGHYIYTGYAFFRQLPAGVPGAYRLFMNMTSVGKANEPINKKKNKFNE